MEDILEVFICLAVSMSCPNTQPLEYIDKYFDDGECHRLWEEIFRNKVWKTDLKTRLTILCKSNIAHNLWQ
jgi:hypothetical protein